MRPAPDREEAHQITEQFENRIRSLRDLLATMDGDAVGKPLSDRLDEFLEDLTLDSAEKPEHAQASRSW